MIRAIFAADIRNGIGKNNTLPWPHNSEDLQWFKTNTIGSVVVMGRNTWEDPKMPKPLPNRYNIVVSKSFIPEGPNMIVQDSSNLGDILKGFSQDVWIIGGATLLKSTKHLCSEIWISRINKDYGCDTYIDLTGFTIFDNYETNTLMIEKYNNETIY